MPAQFQQGNSEVRLERPDFAEDGALFTLIEELLGQEKQAVLVPGFAQAGSQGETGTWGKRGDLASVGVFRRVRAGANVKR